MTEPHVCSTCAGWPIYRRMDCANAPLASPEPLDLELYRRRAAEIRATLEAQAFYDDPKATIPDDYDALIAEIEELRRDVRWDEARQYAADAERLRAEADE